MKKQLCLLFFVLLSYGYATKTFAEPVESEIYPLQPEDGDNNGYNETGPTLIPNDDNIGVGTSRDESYKAPYTPPKRGEASNPDTEDMAASIKALQDRIEVLERMLRELLVQWKDKNSKDSYGADAPAKIEKSKEPQLQEKESVKKEKNPVVSSNMSEAMKHLKNGDIGAAESALLSIAESSSGEKGRALYLLGIIELMQKQRPEEAEKHFKKACAFFAKKKKLSDAEEFFYRMAMLKLIKALRACGKGKDAKVIEKHFVKLPPKKGKHFDEINRELRTLLEK